MPYNVIAVRKLTHQRQINLQVFYHKTYFENSCLVVCAVFVCITVKLIRDKNKEELHIASTSRWNPPVITGCPSQRTSNVKSVSMSWRHHVACVGRPNKVDPIRRLWYSVSLFCQVRWKTHLNGSAICFTPVYRTQQLQDWKQAQLAATIDVIQEV